MNLIEAIVMLLGLINTSLAIPGALPDGLSLRASSKSALPYPLVPMTFAGTIGGHQVQFNGTIQEIHVHMKKVHPEFDPDALYAANKNISARQNDFNIGAQFAGGLVGRGGKLLPPGCCPVASWGWGDTDVGYFNKA